MARAKAACGTYSAYKRHLRDGEPVDDACRQASVERSREQSRLRKGEELDAERVTAPPAPPRQPNTSRQESLEWNLALVEAAMQDVEASKLAPLSKRHSELLAELATVCGGTVKEADPFDAFFSGDFSNVVGFPTSEDRKMS